MGEFVKITENSEEARNTIFKSWFNTLSEDQKKFLKISNALEMKIDSISQMDRLHKVFGRNRKCISFWLFNCVFPKDMKQF